MLRDKQREVIGQAEHMHQSCWLPGRSVMNNLSRMTDVSDVWFSGIIGATDVWHDAEAAEGQRRTLTDEQGRQKSFQKGGNKVAVITG